MTPNSPFGLLRRHVERVTVAYKPGPLGGVPETEDWVDVSDLEAIADAVRDARRRKHLTQQELADEVGVNLGVIQKFELAKSRPQPANFRKILTALDLDIETTPVVAGDRRVVFVDEDQRQWPPDVAVVLDVIGMWLGSLPDEDRPEAERALTRFAWNYRANGHS